VFISWSLIIFNISKFLPFLEKTFNQPFNLLFKNNLILYCLMLFMYFPRIQSSLVWEKDSNLKKSFLLFCRGVTNCSFFFSFCRYQSFCYPTDVLDITFMVDQYMGMQILTWKKWTRILKEKRYECYLFLFLNWKMGFNPGITKFLKENPR
jgi:hypothetical protein